MSRNVMLAGCVCLLTGVAWVSANQQPDKGKDTKATPKHQVDIRGEDGKVLVSADQIRFYHWATHTLTLAPKVREQLAEQLRKTKGLIPGIPFTVCVDGKAVYKGAFTTSSSSATLSTAAIVVDPLDVNLTPDQLRIQLGYPGDNFSKGDDPRADQRIREALKATGKLDGANDLTPEQKQAAAVIEKRGGAVQPDLETGGLKVTFTKGFVTDADLKDLRASSGISSLRLLFAGEVTDAGLAHLNELPELRSLELMGTRATDDGIKIVAQLSKLRRLTLSGTVGDSSLAHLKSLKALEELTLGGYGSVTDAGLAHLKDMTSLRSLHFFSIRAPVAVSDAGLAHLAGLTELRNLTLGSASKVTSAGLKHLQNLKQLQALDLHQTSVSDEGMQYLQRLKQLKSLDLGHTAVTDMGLVLLKDLANLETLHLPEGVTPVGLAALKDFAALQALHLPFSVTNDGMKALSPLVKLKELHHVSERVTDEGLAHVKSLTRLQILGLRDAHVSGTGLKELADLKELRSIQMWYVPLADGDLEALKGLTGLQELSLKGSQRVTDKGLEHLKVLKNLKTLDLRDTAVTSEGTRALREALPQTTVQSRR